MQKGIITRLVSHKILYNLKIKNANFDEIFNFYITKYSLSLRDRKLVNNIVLNSMRYNTLIDKIITRYVKKKINIDQYLLILSATTQMVFLNFKSYAVIHSTVELSKKNSFKIFPGFINAVLKNILNDKDKIKNTQSQYKNLPAWFIAHNENWELNEKVLFLNSINKKPDLHIVFKNIQSVKKFNYENVHASKTSLVIPNQLSIKLLPRFDKGEWWIQDYASMLPLYLTSNIKNISVLDMCAAPGGKSFQALNYGAKLDIIEINPQRANTLKENLNRLKFKNPIKVVDALKIGEEKKYDLILVDAPCSSVGTVRRNPEIFFRSSVPNFNKITSLQNKLLNKAKRILKKRGTIIYMVCSFLKLETTNQIQNFLRKNPNFYNNKFILKDNEEKLIDGNGFINIIPRKYKNFNIDGFFAARLTRND
ncbi:RsmD family RNA methyltransferase [Alphaproteobacteria bacterium]|nr:RsmD family RNA methyltransferase [Alphaproteobacteria bacterium]